MSSSIMHPTEEQIISIIKTTVDSVTLQLKTQKKYVNYNSMRSRQKCLASRNKTPSTKNVLQIFVDGALFFEEVTSTVNAVSSFLVVREDECPVSYFIPIL